MEKIIKIDNKEIRLKSSLFTIIDYKNTFGSDLFDDISKLSLKENINGISNISTVIGVLFQIIYILQKPFNKIAYEDFINEFDFSLLSDNKALEEITKTIGEILGSVRGSNQNKNNP